MEMVNLTSRGPSGLSIHDQDRGVPVLYAFSGRSMLPTLQAGDLLELETSALQIHIGDIICFRSPDDSLIVHRVRGISPDGYRTRGDNRPEDDTGLADRGSIIGRVEAVWRRKQRLELTTGRLGIILAFIRRFSCRVTRLLGRNPLNLTFLPGTATHLLPARLKPRLVVFNHQMRLFMGNRCIGFFDAALQSWRIPWRYRLLVDISILPSHDKTVR